MNRSGTILMVLLLCGAASSAQPIDRVEVDVWDGRARVGDGTVEVAFSGSPLSLGASLGGTRRIELVTDDFIFDEVRYPEARDRIRELHDLGVDGVKLDRGQSYPLNVTPPSGRDPRAMHNHHGYLMVKTYAEALQEARGRDYQLTPRAGAAGTQSWTVKWPGDMDSDRDSRGVPAEGGMGRLLGPGPGAPRAADSLGARSPRADPAIHSQGGRVRVRAAGPAPAVSHERLLPPSTRVRRGAAWAGPAAGSTRPALGRVGSQWTSVPGRLYGPSLGEPAAHRRTLAPRKSG
jgi:hypothetical protein